MKKLSRLLITLSFLIIISFGVVNADDFGYWSTYTIDSEVNDKLKIRAIEEFHIEDDISEFNVNEIYFGPIYKLNDMISTGIFYKNVQAKSGDKWNTTNRMVMDLYSTNNLKNLNYFFSDINWWDIKIDGRNRMEYNATKGTWLYRTRIGIAKDFEIADRTYTPFINNEMFINLNDNFEYNENRAIIGVGTDFVFGTKIKVYYMSRMKKGSTKWTNANILCTSISYKF